VRKRHDEERRREGELVIGEGGRGGEYIPDGVVGKFAFFLLCSVSRE
jgi:hypothetical protein